MVAALVRQLASLNDASGEIQLDGLIALLERASRLPGKQYGETSISAAQALLSLRTPPFNTRLAELRATLQKSTDNDALARSATITAGVDLLTALFTDEDAKVRAAAIEVYIRRTYRAHRILSLAVEEVDGILVANWTFKFADTPDDDSPLRRGFFTVFPSLEAYTNQSERITQVRPVPCVSACALGSSRIGQSQRHHPPSTHPTNTSGAPREPGGQGGLLRAHQHVPRRRRAGPFPPPSPSPLAVAD